MGAVAWGVISVALFISSPPGKLIVAAIASLRDFRLTTLPTVAHNKAASEKPDQYALAGESANAAFILRLKFGYAIKSLSIWRIWSPLRRHSVTARRRCALVDMTYYENARAFSA